MGGVLPRRAAAATAAAAAAAAAAVPCLPSVRGADGAAFPPKLLHVASGGRESDG